MSDLTTVQNRLKDYYNIVKEEERKPKSERRPDLAKIKNTVAVMTRWTKELKK